MLVNYSEFASQSDTYYNKGYGTTLYPHPPNKEKMRKKIAFWLKKHLHYGRTKIKRLILLDNWTQLVNLKCRK